jgi:predicted O-methyltransferase YrrM
MQTYAQLNVESGGKFDFFLSLSEQIPGWTRGDEARELMRLSYSLPDSAELVEIGSFLGSGATLLAGARKIRGSGVVHCVDPFDGSGDEFSVPHYRDILAQVGEAQCDRFQRNVQNAGVAELVLIYRTRAEDLADNWTRRVDLMFFDGDQSRASVREVYRKWIPYLKIGGVLALHNSHPTNYRAEHDGHRCLVEEEIHEPKFADIRLIDDTTFAIKNEN